MESRLKNRLKNRLKRRVLFLDYDGVINTQVFYKSDHPTKIKVDEYYVDMCMPSDGRVSNKQAVYLIDMLCRKYDLSIVVTSTWRLRDNYKEVLYNSGLGKDIIVEGCTDRINMNRGKEIDKYLLDNEMNSKYLGEDPITDYIIIDDDTFDLQDHLDKLVVCNTYDGFTFSKYIEACNKLERWLIGDGTSCI